MCFNKFFSCLRNQASILHGFILPFQIPVLKKVQIIFILYYFYSLKGVQDVRKYIQMDCKISLSAADTRQSHTCLGVEGLSKSIVNLTEFET